MNVIIMRDSDNTGKEITRKINSLDELMQLYDEMKKRNYNWSVSWNGN